MNFFSNYFQNIHNACKSIDQDFLEYAYEAIEKVQKNNSKIIIAGNGGSAAMASHVSVDFTKAANIRAINFNEADLITCFANDFGYENWLSEAIKRYALDGDLLILISSSGTSKNIINAGHAAINLSLPFLTFSGFSPDNPLRKLGNANAWVNSNSYNIIEMTHHIWLLSIMDNYIEHKVS